MKKIAVLMGGDSNEREVSLESGKNVAEALRSLGDLEVVAVDVRGESLADMPRDIDAAYIALHGGWGENGGVQEALDQLGIPYTGPGAAASRIAMDKIRTKQALDAQGVPNAPWSSCTEATAPETSPFGYPVVVKAPRDGSSVGVYKCDDDRAFRQAIAAAARIDREKFGGEGTVLIETFLPGREMTVGVIDAQALPAVEIFAKGGWYGYEEKYHSDETRYPFLADSSDPSDRELELRLAELAVAAYRAVGCRSVTRVDFRVSPDGTCNVLELNTSPGFTAHSLVPKAGIRTGLTFAGVCARILQSAKCG